MDTDTSASTTAIYVERLQQAVRVMEGLSETERSNFNISVIAVRRKNGISACVAGLCGLDPWFQARGLTATVAEEGTGSIGHISVDIDKFFGTGRPFYRDNYERGYDDGVTVDDAIAALKGEIASFEDTPPNGEVAAT